MRQWTICDDTLGTVSTYLRDAPISPVMAREAIYGASKKNRWYPPRRCWDRYVAQGWDNRWGILSVVAEDYASKTYESSDSERLGHELENRPADARYALYKLLIN